MVENITLYIDSFWASPFAQRVVLALEELGVKYAVGEIVLKNKPDWYATKVNPAGKVPAIAYGGPSVPADHPSPDSFKLAESLVILEFLADLYPNSSLLPKDPVLRAKALLFIEISRNTAQPWYAFYLRGENPEAVEKSLDDVQKLLPANGKYALGDEFTMADIAAVPLLAIADIMMRNEIGLLADVKGKELATSLKGPKFARLWKYLDDAKTRPSFQKAFREESILEMFRLRSANA